MNFVWHDAYSDQIRIASGARSQDFAPRSLVAVSDGSTVSIRLRNSTDNVLAADWTAFGDQIGNGFLSPDALMTYLVGEFGKKQPDVPSPYPISATASMSVAHGFAYAPRVTITDASGAEVDTDVAHSPGQTTLMFAAPFTGTLYLG